VYLTSSSRGAVSEHASYIVRDDDGEAEPGRRDYDHAQLIQRIKQLVDEDGSTRKYPYPVSRWGWPGMNVLVDDSDYRYNPWRTGSGL